MAKYLSQKIRAGAPDNHRWDGWCSWTFVPNNQNNYDLSSCEYLRHRTHWCVPAGITCAFVEVWGGGGEGAGVCCCAIATPSGSGAYANKYIKVTEGDCYFVHAGWQFCCRSAPGGMITQGPRDLNRNSYIIGPGLTNFCAEVGYAGVSVCCPKVRMDSADSASRYKLKSFQDSGCAKFYGADYGVNGMPGYIQLPAFDSSGDQARLNTYNNQPVSWKAWVPYPGGYFDCKGGHAVQRFCAHGENNIIGLGGQEVANKVGVHMGRSCTCHPHYIEAGWGVAGPWTGVDAICCSPPSRPGKVRITYR
tara:strand:- start:796 stop:1713 length:918 start_codon:yes stop_codon:yes gene_type:complete